MKETRESLMKEVLELREFPKIDENRREIIAKVLRMNEGFSPFERSTQGTPSWSEIFFKMGIICERAMRHEQFHAFDRQLAELIEKDRNREINEQIKQAGGTK